MFGCESAATARASCSNRRTRSASPANRSGRTLTATSRPSRVSRARYTSPIPPAPRGDTISYGPRRVPASRVMGSGSLARGRRRAGRTGDPEPGDHLLEAGLGSEAVPERVDVQVGHQARAIGEGLLDPVEGPALLAESRVDEGPV